MTGQMAAIDPGGPAVAGAGPVGLLAAADSGGVALDPDAVLSEIEPFGGSGVALAQATAGPASRADAVGEHATAAAFAPVGRVPCGTGWPDGRSGDTGWPCGTEPSPKGQLSEEDQASGGERSCALAGQRGSVPRARNFARSTVCSWGLAHLCDDVMAVVSELVTNALVYGLARSAPVADGVETRPVPPDLAAGGWPPEPIELRLMLRQGDVVCMVADPGTGIPVVTEPGQFAEGGRGLQVVQSCSDHWGWDPIASGGKVVWAAFRR